MSADYLLGISSLEEDIRITENRAQNAFYKQYIKCRNNYEIDQSAVYYWIEALGDKIGGQTEFCKWNMDGNSRKEVRRLREVILEKAIALCSLVKGKPMVLNCEADARAFQIFGGQAIAKKEVCEKYLPWYLRDFVVESEFY